MERPRFVIEVRPRAARTPKPVSKQPGTPPAHRPQPDDEPLGVMKEKKSGSTGRGEIVH
jgi:hypothetical protein